VTWAPAGRDSHDIDALVTDRYLETLLVAHARGADAGPTSAEADPLLRLVMARLARDLPRFHPSFRFEEALADRLAAAAARLAWSVPQRDAGTLTVLPDDPSRIALLGELRSPMGRPLLIGGALTSAALSLAGAAYLAWRFSRPTPGPMVRAVRAVARTRLA
jgi:hypothetical protein